MNSKIKKFIEDCTETTEIVNPETGISHYREFFDKEKFAELIVRECVSKIGDEYKDALDDVMEDWDRGFLGGLSYAMDKVQKHFGVEE